MDPRESAIARKNTGRLDPWGEAAPLGVVVRLAFYPWPVVGTVCIGSFMGQLDASIAQFVLPELRRGFHEPVRAVAWVSIAYLLVVTAMVPIVGRLSDILGRKLLYCCGFLVFVLGSGLSGLAPNLDLLIAARVLQALGATVLMANSVAIIVATAGPARRGRALGVQSAAQAVGSSAGPALGRFLISVLGWRWVFWLNVPVGLIGAGIAFIVLPRTERTWNQGRFDLLARSCWFRRSPYCCWRSIKLAGPRSVRRCCPGRLSWAWRC
jgi:MFS family permease